MKIRVTFLLPSLAAGGAERVAVSLLRNLDRDKFEPNLIVLSDTGSLSGERSSDTPVFDLGKPRLRAALPSLFGAVRRIKPDILYSTMHHTNVAVLALGLFLPSVKIVVRESNTPSMSLPDLRYGGLLRVAYRFLYPRAASIVCPSTLIRRELEREFHVPRDRLVLLPNPVNTSGIRSVAGAPVRTPGPGHRFVAVGSLHRQKGFDLLIELMSRTPVTTHLTIVGDGPERANLERMVTELNLSDRVVLLGFADNPWQHMAGADALLLPSRWEGLPNVALEALACGTPVIATPESGGIVDLVSQVPRGHVLLAPIGTSFLEAMESTPISLGALRANLLPTTFDAATVASALGAVFLRVATH
jgi:glycosyltransferase involved in cell wall biosynthesis